MYAQKWMMAAVKVLMVKPGYVALPGKATGKSHLEQEVPKLFKPRLPKSPCKQSGTPKTAVFGA